MNQLVPFINMIGRILFSFFACVNDRSLTMLCLSRWVYPLSSFNFSNGMFQRRFSSAAANFVNNDTFNNEQTQKMMRFMLIFSLLELKNKISFFAASYKTLTKYLHLLAEDIARKLFLQLELKWSYKRHRQCMCVKSWFVPLWIVLVACIECTMPKTGLSVFPLHFQDVEKGGLTSHSSW